MSPVATTKLVRTPAAIRLAEPRDIEAILGIQEQAFAGDHIPRRQILYLMSRPSATVFVVLTHATVVGFAIALLPSLPRPARLYSLAIRPDQHRRGLATTLLEHTLRQFDKLGYGRSRLEVRLGSLWLQRFYRRHGFRHLLALDDYYEDGESALRMEIIDRSEADGTEGARCEYAVHEAHAVHGLAQWQVQFRQGMGSPSSTLSTQLPSSMRSSTRFRSRRGAPLRVATVTRSWSGRRS